MISQSSQDDDARIQQFFARNFTGLSVSDEAIAAFYQNKQRFNGTILFRNHARRAGSGGSRYGIRSIPAQVFFDAGGKEVFRHMGFFAGQEVIQQLTKMGITNEQPRRKQRGIKANKLSI
jgi:hypothetical protein